MVINAWARQRGRRGLGLRRMQCVGSCGCAGGQREGDAGDGEDAKDAKDAEPGRAGEPEGRRLG